MGENKKPGRPKKTTNKEENKSVEVIEKITQTPKVRPQRDMNELIRVISITNTSLIYERKSQVGYRVEWDSFLEENWM